MPAQRKSSKLLERAGAFRKNPDRKRKSVAGRGALPSQPPPHLRKVKGACAAWHEVVGKIPEGIATGSDTIAIERCAMLLASSREKPTEWTAALDSRLGWWANSLGLTISGRESLGGGAADKSTNPFAEVGAPERPKAKVTPIRGA